MRKLLNKFKTKASGSVALTTVLIITAVLLSSGVTLLITSVDLSNNQKGYSSNAKAQLQAKSCLEEALKNLKSDVNYNGTVTISLGGEEHCQAVVSNDTDPNRRKIDTTVTIGDYTTKVSRKADVSGTKPTIVN